MAMSWQGYPKYDKKNNNWLPVLLEQLKKAGYHKVRFTAYAPGDGYRDAKYSGYIEGYFPVAWENTRREPCVEQPRPIHFARPALWELIERSPQVSMGCGNGHDGTHQAQWTSVNCPIAHMPMGYTIGTEHILVPAKKKPAVLGTPIFVNTQVKQCARCKFRWHELTTDRVRERASYESYGFGRSKVDADAIPVDECADCREGSH